MVIGVHPHTNRRIFLGQAEIWIFGAHGKVYKAPNMLYHYVTVHHYKPPDQFVRALKYAPCPPQPEYMQRLRGAGFPTWFLDVYEGIWKNTFKKRKPGLCSIR